MSTKNDKQKNSPIKPNLDDTSDVCIDQLLDSYISYCQSVDKANKVMKCSKNIRKPNFPEIISEYIVKKVLCDVKSMKNIKFGKTGDLVCDNEKIEVKAFMSNGPTSFGPEENWNKLIFVDAKNFKEKKFKVYMIKLANTDKEWQNIKVNQNETIQDQCNQKRRPRIKFKQMYKQINDQKIEVLFDGQIILDNNKFKFN